ncbi:histone-lysine N-methyltransferase SETMAR-like [Schistocerca nitens]|uniref:histone-lysine N-methyltransferase SETMAR-like n=1 Tax=Schistocerca nitens TaxID=7011 RepID=UPI00211835C2|nr:histone-lysine N-methyltransferase SETMAR-like [Schistocerca nitens]
MEIFWDLLNQYEAESDNFLNSIISRDEAWCHYNKPESKRQSVEWQNVNSLSKKKFKIQLPAGKVMCTVFWYRQGVVLLDVLKPGETVNSAHCKTTLTKLKAQISRVTAEKKTNCHLQHDNARPHTNFVTT